MYADGGRGVVLLRRTDQAVDSLEALREENDRVMAKMRPVHRHWGIVVDMRAAPSRNDPEFEAAMQPLRTKVSEGYLRVALLVNSASGVLQVSRITRQEHASTTLATRDLDEALRFASARS
jgi:sulfite reductase (NADPH) flavoprotein alpha-component